MKGRHISALLVTAAILTASLTACGGDTGQGQHITLSVMGRKSDMEKSYMTTIFEHYESATGNRLNLIAIEDADFEKEAADRFASGDVPDIFLHFHNADLSRFQIGENFCYLNDEAWAQELTDSARAYCEDREGNLLGLPFWESSVSGCYYNKTILDSLGMKPATTQEEFDVLCQVLSEIGYTPVCWPADGCTWMYQFGLDPVFADDPELLERLNQNEVSYAEIPEVEAMAGWIGNAADRGWFGPDYLRTGWSDISTELGSGSAVMTFIWDTWFYTDFEQGQKYGIDDFALMPVFMNTAEGGTYEGGNLNMMMVNRNGERLEAAKDFLAFCASPENYNVAFDGISTVSCFRGQTTNIQSKMVTDAQASIAAKERVSTAATRIVGYSADDVAAAFDSLLRGKTDAAGCVKMMDDARMEEARQYGADGF